MALKTGSFRIETRFSTYYNVIRDDFFKLPLNDTCILCAKTGIKVESYKDHIQPKKASLDLIHNNVFGLFPLNYDGIKYFITFLDNYNKALDIILPKRKSNVFVAFQLFQHRHKREDL